LILLFAPLLIQTPPDAILPHTQIRDIFSQHIRFVKHLRGGGSSRLVLPAGAFTMSVSQRLQPLGAACGRYYYGRGANKRFISVVFDFS